MNENIYIMPDVSILKAIGEKFRFLRLRRNITQKQLAEDTQLSLSTIKKIEKGEIASFDSFLRVLRMLHKLDCLTALVEEEDLTPSEYYKLRQSAKKHLRKRATKAKTQSKSQIPTQNTFSKW